MMSFIPTHIYEVSTTVSILQMKKLRSSGDLLKVTLIINGRVMLKFQV